MASGFPPKDENGYSLCDDEIILPAEPTGTFKEDSCIAWWDAVIEEPDEWHEDSAAFGHFVYSDKYKKDGEDPWLPFFQKWFEQRSDDDEHPSLWIRALLEDVVKTGERTKLPVIPGSSIQSIRHVKEYRLSISKETKFRFDLGHLKQTVFVEVTQEEMREHNAYTIVDIDFIIDQE